MMKIKNKQNEKKSKSKSKTKWNVNVKKMKFISWLNKIDDDIWRHRFIVVLLYVHTISCSKYV